MLFFSNAEWLKYHLSNLCSAFRPCQIRRCTSRPPRHPQDGGYKRSTYGALHLATSFKCKSVAHTTSLSGSEPLAGAASAADSSSAGLSSLMAADLIMNLFVFDQMYLVSATNALLSNSSAPAGCRRVSRAQAGRQGAGRNKAVAHCMYSDVQVCTCMCPLNQNKKSAGAGYYQQKGECKFDILKSRLHIVHIVHIIFYNMHIGHIKQCICSKQHIGHIV